MFAGSLDFLISITRIVFLGDTIDFIFSEFKKNALRKYVKKLLEEKYSGKMLDKMKEAIGVNHGAFGFRLNMTSIRTFVDSETPEAEYVVRRSVETEPIVEKEKEPLIPNLIRLHENGDINLRDLAGFEFDEGFWHRKRYKTIKNGQIITNSGLPFEFYNPISKKELDEYISSKGVNGPKFIIRAMRDNVLKTKLDTVSDKSREIGLIPSWIKKEVEVTEKNHIIHNQYEQDGLQKFLMHSIGRSNYNEDQPRALRELCNPVIAGIFKYSPTGLYGISSCLMGSKCLDANITSGATYIDSSPDIIWKYVPMHELGHYFGLCHVAGLDRIMYSAKQKSWFSFKTIPKLIYLKGIEPNFTLNEAKQVWDYIVEHFPSECLQSRK